MLKLMIVAVPALFLAAYHTATPLPEKVDPPKQPRAASSIPTPEAAGQG